MPRRRRRNSGPAPGTLLLLLALAAAAGVLACLSVESAGSGVPGELRASPAGMTKPAGDNGR